MRMHCLFLSVVLAVAAGCTEPIPIDRISILAPGREMRLAFRSEMQTSGVSGMEERSFTISSSGAESRSTVTKREENPYESVVWADMELPLSVIAMPESDSLRVTMMIQRLRQGISYAEKGEKKHEESSSFESDAPTQPKSEFWSILRDAKFVAVVDSQGRLASTDAVGKYWADLKKELTEDAKQQGVSQAQVDMFLRGQTAGVFSALEDAIAYLPPEGVQAGQSWKVRREYVFPYRSFEFGMITYRTHSKEEATCSVRSVKVRGLHSIATIAIRGKRFPHSLERGMPARVKHFDLKGELEVNLNTGAVEKLRLESTPKWTRPEEDGGMEIKFIQMITLKPA